MFRGQSVAVVIPAYNEQDKIAATIRSVPAWVDHVIVVDDASGDATAAVTRETAAMRGRGVEIVCHAENRGVGAAIASGYARALALGAQVTAVMAGDGQMDPEDLPRLLEPIVSGQADYAKGNRFAWPGGWRCMPPVRLVGNLALSYATRVASGYWRLLDSQCGYTAASRLALSIIAPHEMFARYGYPNDVLARLGAARVRVVDVPVRPVYGPQWRSGLRPSRVALPILRLLARGLWRRLAARRQPRFVESLAPAGDGS
jgi:glycosyltransferase involved in cell wall biosynthesis